MLSTNLLKRLFKKTGGNYIYVMWSWKLPHAVKIGVSNAPNLRRGQVNASVSAKVGREVGLTCLALPILFWAYKFEAAIHNLAPSGICVKWLKGTDGGTEWFYTVSPFSAMLIFCLVYGLFGIGNGYWCGVFLLPLLPLDAILILVLVFLLNWGVALGAIYFLIQTIF